MKKERIQFNGSNMLNVVDAELFNMVIVKKNIVIGSVLSEGKALTLIPLFCCQSSLSHDE